ncbi:MAG: AAA family ATPase [Caldimonas sp.]
MASGTGHAVLLGGEAGIGKTSLLRELTQRRGEALLWWGACDALQTPHPLAPLHDIARSAEVSFGSLLLEAGNRTALFEAVLAELQRSRRPILLVIEDVHWADDATLDLLKFIGRRIDGTPCLLVMSFRDDQMSPAHPLRRLLGELPNDRVTRVDVPRLSPAGVELLAGRALRSSAGIHAATRGNPFFVTELLRHGGNDVPRAVQDLVLARYAQLRPDAQAILSLVSVVPTRIEPWLLEQLAEKTVVAIEACLNSGLLTSVEGSALCFRHELARVAIETSLADPVVRALHAAVLGALVDAPGTKTSFARLVHHATRAGDRNAVLRYAPEAARQAEARGAHREAAAHYRTALQHATPEAEIPLDDLAGWLDASARVCQMTDQLEEAIVTRLRLGEFYRRSGDLVREAENLSQLALAYVQALRNSDADGASRRAIEMLETLPAGVELADAYRVEAQLRMLNRDCDESIAWSSKAIELAERLGHREVMVAAISTLGAATMFSDYEAGCAHLLRALDLARTEGFHFIVANTYNSLGSGSGEMFRLDAAQRFMTEAIAFADQHEIDVYRNYCVSWLALCEMYLGHVDDATRHAQDILRQPSACSTSRVMALVALGRIRARRGQEGVDEVLDEALELALASGTLQHIAPVRAARAEAANLRGDKAAAVDEAEAALAMSVKHRHAWFAGELAYCMARSGRPMAVPTLCAEPFALQMAGRWAKAATAWETLGCPYEHARALSEGDAAAQLDALKRFEKMGAKPEADELRRRLRAGGSSVPRGSRSSTQMNPYGLTSREVEVLRLLCEGLKNAAIAERLVRSVRTVDHHLAAVYAKLGVATRTEALAAALHSGLFAGEWRGSQVGARGRTAAVQGLGV